MSKRKLLQLVEDKRVNDWDDPRMPTIAGFRRRGYTPESIRNFCRTIGVTKFDGLTDVAVLEHSIREHLNKVAERRMAEERVTLPLCHMTYTAKYSKKKIRS